MFQSVYYIIYLFQCFETPEYGVWNFHLFMFQFVSKRFETIRILDLDISACFNMFQTVYYIIYMFQCFETPEYGVWNFHLFMFQFVSKRFETIKILDLDISACFNMFQSVYYIIYMFQCFETPEYGSGIFTFLCFSLLQNASKQSKFWT